ncbi:MAG: histidine--tRNA ligase [Planctomycetes bacterium]|nr:histidine--tRNA ligase [Planctomycetota bacterium]MCB9918676.1 histidine--tRNA ligase [Planctomycetota bacterium]
MQLKYSAPRGTEDFLPARVQLLDWIHGNCRRELERHGYLEIRPPLFEDTALYRRAIGDVTDVVEKEMFTCERGDTSVTFRPEATAGVARAYLENKLDKVRPFQKFYYIGPMFRFERPQAARQRQFEQIGVEAIGSHDPRLDAEVIHLAGRLLDRLELGGYRIHINTLGDKADRALYRSALEEYVAPRIAEFCAECQARFQRNVFRLVDCKNRDCQRLMSDAPDLLSRASDATRKHFEDVQNALGALGRSFEIDPRIVRGLDYYTHTVFEVRLPGLGARDTLVGGGRYDDLLEELGGPAIPAIGFSLGVTGTLLALQKAGIADEHANEPPCTVFLAAIGDSERLAALVLADELRKSGLVVDLDYEGKSPKSQMRTAGKRNARIVLLLGESERARGVIQVKNMGDGSQRELPMDGDLAFELQRMLEEEPSRAAPGEGD